MATNLITTDWAVLLPHILVGASVLFVGLLVFLGLDYLTGTDRARPCLVEGRRYAPARTEIRTETEYGFDGQLNLVSHIEHIPALYTLRVCVDGGAASCEVDAACYASVREGQSIDLAFRHGGMTGRRY